MKYTNLSNIEFGQIQAFVAVAELHSFTKAAERLHLSQPVISKRVAALETTLDMPLFLRDRKKLPLTPAGQILFEAWSSILSDMIESINRANTYQLGYRHRLSIGYCASTFPKRIGELFKRSHPEVELYFVKLQYTDMMTKLLSGSIDLMAYGIFAQRDVIQEPFSHEIFGSYPMLIYCRKTHPFAGRADIEVNDLRGQKFIMLSPLVAPMWLSYVTDICVRERFVPQVSMYVDDVMSLAMNLHDDDQVFISDCGVPFDGFDLASVPIRGTRSGFLLAWQRESENAAIKDFVSAARDYFRTQEQSGPAI